MEKIHMGFADLLQATLTGRRFFMTSEGYIGLGPSPTKPEDLICVLLGCSTPVLLRPLLSRAGHYQVVGECYVQGWMYSEVLLGEIPKHCSR